MARIHDLGALHQIIETFTEYDSYKGSSNIIIERASVYGFDERGRADNITEKIPVKGVFIPQTDNIEANDGSGYIFKSTGRLVVVSPWTIREGDIIHMDGYEYVPMDVTDRSKQGTCSASLVRRGLAGNYVQKN